MKHILNKYYAEAFGTFLYVVFGAGAVIVQFLTDGKLGITAIAFSHAVIIGLVVYFFARISGAHINPVVTIALYIEKKIGKKDAVYYIVFQLIGAVLGGFFLRLLFTNVAKATNLGAPVIRGITPQTAFWFEFFITFMLMFVILYVIKKGQRESPSISPSLAIGAIVFIDILFAGPFTGGAMNPARAFGPALVMGFWENHIIYWVAPLLGAVAAVYATRQLFKE